MPATLPASALATVQAVPGVAQATGLVDADGARHDRQQRQGASRRSGRRGWASNWTGEDDLVTAAVGARAPRTDDEIAVNATTAEGGRYRGR